MPGIVPMKLLTSTAGQSRIAQACDRCRSKKTKCDGRLPSCSQCLSVGFECKTSDKLSRRAYPRGYTESLEHRIVTLEAEIRELKGLLDEKEERIDMICKVRSGSALALKSSASAESRSGSMSSLGDYSSLESSSLQISQTLQPVHEDHANAYFMGNSSSRSLLFAYKDKAEQSESCKAFLNVNAFYPRPTEGDVRAIATRTSYDRPARMLTDRLVNIFFQEISPLWPVLHRPTFLKLYDEYVSGNDVSKDPKILAQLFLVFGIAAQDSVSKEESDNFEVQWTIALEAFDAEESLVNAQCLTLATLYFMKRAKYASMLKYKGHAVALSQRLGLHRATDFTSNTLARETRKKVFWTLFTLDSFSAAHLGLPALYDHESALCDLPVDVDDVYITENEFLPTLPNESTKLSSAIALFKLSKVLAKVLRDLYPAASSYRVTCQSIAALQDELDDWSSSLPAHLRLHFENDKPSTRMVSDRSPILSFSFHYVKSLISKVIILADSPSQHQLSSSMVTLSSSARKMIQIGELLHERGMTFAFCLDEHEVLLSAVFGLLLENLNLELSGVTVQKENIKLARAVVRRFQDDNCGCQNELSTLLASESLDVERYPSGHVTSTKTAPCDARAVKAEHHRRRGQGATFHSQVRFQDTVQRSCSQSQRKRSEQGPSTQSMPMLDKSGPRHVTQRESASLALKHTQKSNKQSYNLAIELSSAFKYGNEEVSSKDWQDVLSNLDSGQNNIYDVIYGGPTATNVVDYSSMSSLSPEQPHYPYSRKTSESNTSQQNRNLWAPDDWNLSSHFSDPGVNGSTSVVSFSSEETPSLDGFGDLAFANSVGDYSGIVIPDDGTPPLMMPSEGWLSSLDRLLNP